VALGPWKPLAELKEAKQKRTRRTATVNFVRDICEIWGGKLLIIDVFWSRWLGFYSQKFSPKGEIGGKEIKFHTFKM